jgi:hypothetical protein
MRQMRKSSRSALAFSVVVLCAGYAAKARAEPVAVAVAPTLAAENDAHDIRAGIPQTVVEWGRGAMLFDGLGDFHRKATTSSAQARLAEITSGRTGFQQGFAATCKDLGR